MAQGKTIGIRVSPPPPEGMGHPLKAGPVRYAKPLHTLRKNCITDWATHFPAHVVKQWAGHSSLDTTDRYYLQVSEAEYERAAVTRMSQNATQLPTQLAEEQANPAKQKDAGHSQPPATQELPGTQDDDMSDHDAQLTQLGVMRWSSIRTSANRVSSTGTGVAGPRGVTEYSNFGENHEAADPLSDPLFHLYSAMAAAPAHGLRALPSTGRGASFRWTSTFLAVRDDLLREEVARAVRSARDPPILALGVAILKQAAPSSEKQEPALRNDTRRWVTDPSSATRIAVGRADESPADFGRNRECPCGASLPCICSPFRGAATTPSRGASVGLTSSGPSPSGPSGPDTSPHCEPAWP